MKKSRYFAELVYSYGAEIDDLMTNSEGKTVLQKRLNDKRRALTDLLPMIAFSPEMVAVVFYDAFTFHAPDLLAQVIASEPDDDGFIAWSELKTTLSVAAWAQALVTTVEQERGGDAFLVACTALEFLRCKNDGLGAAPEAAESDFAEKYSADEEQEGEREDAADLGEAGSAWLSEQGFEPLDSP